MTCSSLTFSMYNCNLTLSPGKCQNRRRSVTLWDGCKAPGKPEGIVVQRCDVRPCAREKKLECCIECDELPACDKDLWRRFPDFKKQVVELQKKYRAQA